MIYHHIVAAILEVQDDQHALDPGGGDRGAVRGGRLEAALPPRGQHGATRLRGVPQVR